MRPGRADQRSGFFRSWKRPGSSPSEGCSIGGLGGGPDPRGLPASLESARPGTLIVDIVYAPEQTPFLAEAARRGLPTLGGLPMLIYQGALAFELWTGVRAPIDVMFAAARNELARRAGGGS